jgi:hypothetical protein
VGITGQLWNAVRGDRDAESYTEKDVTGHLSSRVKPGEPRKQQSWPMRRRADWYFQHSQLLDVFHWRQQYSASESTQEALVEFTIPPASTIGG